LRLCPPAPPPRRLCLPAPPPRRLCPPAPPPRRLCLPVASPRRLCPPAPPPRRLCLPAPPPRRLCLPVASPSRWRRRPATDACQPATPPRRVRPMRQLQTEPVFRAPFVVGLRARRSLRGQVRSVVPLLVGPPSRACPSWRLPLLVSAIFRRPSARDPSKSLSFPGTAVPQGV